MDVSAIKNTSSKQQIRSKISTISAVQVFGTKLHPFHFLGFFLNTRSTWECSIYFLFFDCSVQARIYSLFFFKKSEGLFFFSCNLITFNSNWSINSPRETAVDIVLDVSENSHGNIYSEVLSKVAACQYGVY